MTDVYRGVICKLEILRGQDVLYEGHERARQLYNFTRYCAVGFNRKISKARGETSLAGKLPPYPGAVGMWKALHDTEEYSALNDRVANYVIRGFDQSMRSWFANLKRNPRARPPRYAENPPPMTFELGRNAKWYDDNVCRFSVLSGDVENRYVYARIYLPPMTCPERIESVKVLADGRCALSYKLRTKNATGQGVAAVDLGIRNLAALAFENGESILYPGGLLLSVQRYFQMRIAKCKPSGYRGNGDGRHLPNSDRSKSYYAKWSQQKSLILHNFTASIVSECAQRGVGVIVVGDLKDIRKDANGDGKDFGSQTNQQFHAWPFLKIVEMLSYKAEEVGIRVEKISERNTSRTCSACGHVNSKSARIKRGLLVCRLCGAELHADVNGAFNILQKYLRADKLEVAGGFPAQPSTALGGEPAKRNFANQPSFSARFDLRNFAVSLHSCGN